MMKKPPVRSALLAGMLCGFISICGCSQFRAPEIEAAPQSYANPFDEAVNAARNGDLGYVQACVESDPRYVEGYDRAGRTLLHHAAERGEKRLVVYLLEQGASVLAEDEEGFTPLDLSLQAVAPQGVVDMLREAMLKEAGAS